MCVPMMLRVLGVDIAENTQQERRQNSNALKNSLYRKSASCAGAFSPMMDWMTSSPSLIAREYQVLPRALLCLSWLT